MKGQVMSRQATDEVADVRDVLRHWAEELLEEPDVSLEDNFLDRGGHSLLAVELSVRIEERFGAPINMRVLFENSIREVADELAGRCRQAGDETS